MNKLIRSVALIMSFAFFSFATSFLAIHMGNKVSKRISSSAVKSQRVVVIDAGHGGIDGGAEADDGTLEKDLNLALALCIRDFLESSGVDVVLTRERDIMYAESSSPHKKLDDLNERIRITEEAGALAFVSIHMNKFPVPKYSGLQVYYSENNEESAVLAEMIQGFVSSNFQPDNKRAVKPAGSSIYLLDKLECPAVLVECGFLSNPDELKKLKSEDYRKSLAVLIGVCILEYTK